MMGDALILFRDTQPVTPGVTRGPVVGVTVGGRLRCYATIGWTPGQARGDYVENRPAWA
jgi:hypothetical protein